MASGLVGEVVSQGLVSRSAILLHSVPSRPPDDGLLSDEEHTPKILKLTTLPWIYNITEEAYGVKSTFIISALWFLFQTYSYS